jgi:hypothetical protein
MERGRDDYITVVHWRCSAEEGEFEAGSYGSITFMQEDGEEIIPFADLTEELVLGWTFEKLDKIEIETALQERLNKLANPPVFLGVPWLPAE